MSKGRSHVRDKNMSVYSASASNRLLLCSVVTAPSCLTSLHGLWNMPETGNAEASLQFTRLYFTHFRVCQMAIIPTPLKFTLRIVTLMRMAAKGKKKRKVLQP